MSDRTFPGHSEYAYNEYNRQVKNVLVQAKKEYNGAGITDADEKLDNPKKRRWFYVD